MINYHPLPPLIDIQNPLTIRVDKNRNIHLVFMTILEQESKLRELQQSLKQRNIDLHWSLSPSLHDREVRLDTGWVVKIGRGLDIFQPPEGKMVLGYFNLGLRKCLETTVDIFFKK